MQTGIFYILRKIRKVVRKKRVVKRKGNKGSRNAYLKNKEAARNLVKERILYFNKFYGFKVGKIAIRNQKTRWGSCSTKGNLNFNYKIVLLPKRLSDYIIVHELCHLKEFNHSHKFWSLVLKTIPDYKKIRKELKERALAIATK